MPAKRNWKPVKKGPVYCSPSCGNECKHADWLKAREEAGTLAKILGPGWKPRVWENLGWHWEVNFTKARLSICRPFLGSPEYEVNFEKDYPLSRSTTGTMQIRSNHKNPRKAVEKLLEKLETFALDMMDTSHAALTSLRN